MKNRLIISLAFLFVLLNLSHSQDDVNLFDFWKYYTDSENAMYLSSCQLAFEQLQERKEAMALLQTKDDYRVEKLIDIRPALDVGIGIIEETHPMGHNDHLYNRNHSAFFDYTANVSSGKPLPGIPVVQGAGTVTIKNGVIKNASHATITNCRFEIESPFIINRHGSEFYAMDLRGEKASEVSFSEFYGGQGCLVFKGKHSIIHHNLFVNRQTVTNHYSVMAMGDSSLIFENPAVNTMNITAQMPYVWQIMVRSQDHPGAASGTGSTIINFTSPGKNTNNIPAIYPWPRPFSSVPVPGKIMYLGTIYIHQEDPETDAEAYAFYIGNARGGHLFNNQEISMILTSGIND